jgi:hypothetical protein
MESHFSLSRMHWDLEPLSDYPIRFGLGAWFLDSCTPRYNPCTHHGCRHLGARGLSVLSLWANNLLTNGE